MARLSPELAPGHWHRMTDALRMECVDVTPAGVAQVGAQCPTFHDHNDAEQRAFDAIPADRIWASAAADGLAYYYIRSTRPLVLAHIPYGDRYRVHHATIRGLRIKDVRDYQRVAVAR